MNYYPRVSLNHLMMVLAFGQTYLWFLSILVVYDPYSILSIATTTFTYLLLRCLLSVRYGNLFCKVIVLPLLI